MAKIDAEIAAVVRYIFSFAVGIGLIYYFRRYIISFIKSQKLRLFAWTLNRFMTKINKILRKEKETVFRHLDSLCEKLGHPLTVLEVGSGPATNFDYYPRRTEIVCLEPNPYFKSYIEQNAHKHKNISLSRVVQGFAERMDYLEDSSFDAVVCTLVMCSVRDPRQALDEVKRVLKPGGIFIFVEHVAAREGSFVNKIQKMMNPVWKTLCDGCNLTRNTAKYIQNAGFSDVNIVNFQLQWGFRLLTLFIRPSIYGYAIKGTRI
ncbi:hypothetical protein CHS0354_010855 [Potamilus streckersoni]|uniref:Methyltransferase type 11 domain-containing protein n=1 Tax=Potamilus streckersoni TaxID=2493646 RepID=A0AAE0SNY4_9BIVA|nr:hypothetical protein CHS0354_010855 [Potamilus streckersoni]